jgi:hypothetical protein
MRHRRLWWLGAIAVAAISLVALAFAVGEDGLATGKDPISSFLYGRHPSEPEDCGAILASGASHLVGEGSHQIRLVLAVDDEWLARFGADAELQARAIVEDVSPLFGPFGIDLDTVKFERWSSLETGIAAHSLFAQVKQSVSLAGSDAVLALTGHQLWPTDGAGAVGGTHTLVSHHPGHPERDRLVAAHELGHLFGARDASPESAGSNIMIGKGFDHDLVWDACHERLLRLNAARFQRAGGVTD